VRYVVATDCEHSRYYTNGVAAGIEWCAICNQYVGVIVMQVPRSEREAVTPASETGR
jgi:hypothetical protein